MDITEEIVLSQEEQSNHLFPVFLKLEKLNVLLVGAGNVALEKLMAIKSNAPLVHIKVVALQVSEVFAQKASALENITIYQKEFEETDFDAIDIAIIAINNENTSAHIKQLANKKNILVNVADTPQLCDFYLGAIVNKGNLKIAISTNGKSPTVAKRLKETLSEVIPAEMEEVLENMHEIRDNLKGNFQKKVRKLNDITKVLVEKDGKAKELSYKKMATRALIIFSAMLIGHFIFSYIPFRSIGDSVVELYKTLDKSFLIMVAAGFIAQMVDGALGMGYGVTSATILLSAGVNPAAISGSIHTAEMFASGASGYSHYKFGNVNKKLFKALLIPGVIGAIAGAIILVWLGEKYGNMVRPALAAYTMFLGIRILFNAFKDQVKKKKFTRYGLLAGTGGFFDSFGGGGWGPIVTSTLITKGRTPRFVIGSVSVTEFFVTLSSAFTFFILLGVSHWQTILGLIIGGLVAAPLAARLAGKLPRKTSMVLVGILVIIWSVRILVKLV